MSERIHILGTEIDRLTLKETLSRIADAIKKKQPVQHIVVNAAKIVNMRKDAALKRSVLASDIINPDGMAVVWASKILGKGLTERIAGIDLMVHLIKLAHEQGFKIFFFGAKEEIVAKVVEKYTDQYSTEIIAGYRNGYYTKDEEPAIAQQIADSGADILFVAISSPKKEIFLDTYNKTMQVPFIMGVGGSFDVVAGKTKRAPKWMQKCGMEWFYRFLQEPGRMWKRYLVTNTLFLWMVFRERLGFKYN